MKKIRFIFFVMLSPLMFGNFGMVEYAVLHPKTKSIQIDSLDRKQKQVNLYEQEPSTAEVKSDDEKTTQLPWSAYLVLGIKTIGQFLLSLLARI